MVPDCLSLYYDLATELPDRGCTLGDLEDL
jgi:hypothetical protein